MDLRSLVSTTITERRRRRLLVSLCAGVIVVVALTVSLVTLAFAVTPSFPDVPASHPYYAAITDLATRSIIGGYGNGNFGPGDPVTRQQFAKMVVLTGGYPVSEANVCFFVDVEKSDATTFYPDNYVAVCAANGITTGKTATTFDPYSNITRYQVITMVVRMADNLQPGLLAAPPAGYTGTGSWPDNPTHGANARRAEYNGLLAGLNLAALDPNGNMSRGEVAQVLHNLLTKLTPVTTTTTAATTTTTTEATTTTTTSSTTTTSTSTTTTTVPNTGFEDLGGALTSGPAVCSWASGRLDVFARGNDGALWHKWYSGGWSGWQSLGGVIQSGSDPAAVSWGSGRIDVFLRGTDNALWHKYYSGGWSGYDSHGGTLTSSPAVASWASNRLDIFTRGTTGHLMHLWWNGSSWSIWQDLGGTLKSGSSPAAVSWGPNRIDVFVRGVDDALWHKWWNGSAWSGWESLGGILTSSPGVSSWASGRLDVFVRGPGNTLWHKWYSGGWSGWQDLGGAPIASDPDAVSWGTNRIDVFMRGTDNALWHKWWNGTFWKP